MGFITEDFLLQTQTARHLYREYASTQPVLDYHSHLSAKDIAQDRTFTNLFEIWLEGDHYKWRAMRSNGIPEHYCTGNAAPYEKFLAWARTVPHTLRNPLYHWTHLELKRYFDIDELLDEDSAPRVWRQATSFMGNGKLTARGILRKFKVRALCTTDDPTDDLSWHKKIEDSDFQVRVYPTFRPDRALKLCSPAQFNSWVDCLAKAANCDISRLADFLRALEARHNAFHQHGCRLSDHGMEKCYASSCSEKEAGAIFDQVRSGSEVTAEEQDLFASFMMLFFGRLDAEKGWTKQLHLGACRDVNTRMREKLGPDSGFDSIGDFRQVQACAAYLDRLDKEDSLPKIVLYNANPADNYTFATMIGNFQNGHVAGKIQMGSAWWFLDHREGIEWQLNALSRVGLLSRFIGMVTDSRSFMSFPRHEYFRRVLCNLLGSEMESGDLPNDEGLVSEMIVNICYNNVARYLGLDVGSGKMVEASAATKS